MSASALFTRGVRLLHTTPAACRGTKHLDWWVRARAHAPRATPRVFPAETLHGRPRRRAFIDFSLGGGGAPADGKAAPALSRVVFELADDIVPVTVSNFLTLGARPRATTGYVGAEVFKAQKGFAVFVGDAAAGPDGRLGHSSFRARFFPDENFIGRHSEPGVLAMASAGVHTNASVFYVTLAKAPHLDGRCVVFGRTLTGLSTLAAIGSMPSVNLRPSAGVTVEAVGEIAVGSAEWAAVDKELAVAAAAAKAATEKAAAAEKAAAEKAVAEKAMTGAKQNKASAKA